VINAPVPLLESIRITLNDTIDRMLLAVESGEVSVAEAEDILRDVRKGIDRVLVAIPYANERGVVDGRAFEHRIKRDIHKRELGPEIHRRKPPPRTIDG